MTSYKLIILIFVPLLLGDPIATEQKQRSTYNYNYQTKIIRKTVRRMRLRGQVLAN